LSSAGRSTLPTWTSTDGWKWSPPFTLLDAVAVFPRRELRSQPLARVQPIARVLNCNLIRARRIGDFKDFVKGRKNKRHNNERR
jgi:hypothetical protein